MKYVVGCAVVLWGFVVAGGAFAVQPKKAMVPAYAPPPAAPLPALTADGKPQMGMEEAKQQFETLGYRFGNNVALNLCGRPAQPHVEYKDLNGDKFPEAILSDSDKACYGGPFVSIASRQRNGVWAWVFRGRGTLIVGPKANQGWLDLHLKTKCDTLYQHDTERYSAASYCQADLPSPNAPFPPEPMPADFSAAFVAAGFTQKNGVWQGCDPEFPSTAAVQNGDYRDLNQDGVNELIITDGGDGCYGMTGQGFFIMTRNNGVWTKFYNSPGIPEFLPTAVKTPGGWPDIEVGGPGFCFPVMRWNGADYVQYRNHEYDKGACKRQGM